MDVAVKQIELWRTEIDNEPGSMASTLAPLAESGADLQVVMVYRFPGNEDRGAIEVYPISGGEQEKAARRAGLTPFEIPTLLIDGVNKPGLGRAMAEAIAETGINMAFFVAQVVEKRYSAVIGFEGGEDARTAQQILEKVAAAV